MVDRQRLLEEFMELARIDSETRHEEKISLTLKKKFSDLGLRLAEDNAKAATGHGANNHFYTLEASPGHEQHPAIFFTCHMDTVAPGNGIKPRLDDDGYIRSDGTTILGSDDKAGIAVMLELLRVLKEDNVPHGKLQFIITVGEERGLLGSRALDPKHIEAKLGFALDSNGQIGDICTSAPSRAEIHVTIRGKSAHAGVNPEDGISAIQVASRAISRMPLGRIDKETTANIGRFEGGGEPNVVCDQVKIHAEARSQDMEKLTRQIAAMKEGFESAAEEYGAQAEFVSNIAYPSYRHEDSEPVVQIALRAMEKIGKKGRLFASGGGSDANVFNGLGFPTVNLAVGYEHIHTTKEQIKLSDMEELAKAAQAIVEEAASGRLPS